MAKICFRHCKKAGFALVVSVCALYITYRLVNHEQQSRRELSSMEDEIMRDENTFHVITNEKIHKRKSSNRKHAAKKDSNTLLKRKKMEQREITHVAFLKVHKTASSTTQNVFLRFGSERNLTFILPHTAGESGWLNVISYNNSLTLQNVVPPPPGRHFDILCCHVIYNRKQFAEWLPKDTVYIGIVRDPLTRFQSAVKYFIKSPINRIKGDHPLSKYAKSPLKYETADPKDSQTNNRMAVEFGFPLELFPGKSMNSSRHGIKKYLQKIDKDFRFIIVSERFDESMVYMRRILHWSTKDILYLDQNVGSKKTNPRKLLQESDKSKINELLYLDNALYKFSVMRFEKQIAEEGADFIKEVEHYVEVKDRVRAFCSANRTNTYLTIDESKWDSQFTVKKSYCELFTRNEKAFIQRERYRMYGTLYN